MLQQPQAPLHNHVLEHRPRRDIDRAPLRRHDDHRTLEHDPSPQIDRARNGQMIELQDLRDARDALLEVAHLLEVGAELDQRRGAEAVRVDDELAVLERVQVRLDEHEVRARLDGQEAAARHVDAVCVAEVADRGADGRLELHDGDVRLALLVGGDRLVVGDDFHLQLVVLDHALDGLEVEPDVVGVEVLELLDRFEFVGVLLGDLGDFE